MKKVLFFLILQIASLKSGYPILELNAEAVEEFALTIVSCMLITEMHQQRLLANIKRLDCNVLFHYKNIEYQASPLFVAVVIENQKLLKTLIARGASVDFPTAEGVTPLMQASYQNSICIIQELLKSGASKDKKDIQGKTVYEYAAEGQRDRYETPQEASGLYFYENPDFDSHYREQEGENTIYDSLLFNPDFIPLPSTDE